MSLPDDDEINELLRELDTDPHTAGSTAASATTSSTPAAHHGATQAGSPRPGVGHHASPRRSERGRVHHGETSVSFSTYGAARPAPQEDGPCDADDMQDDLNAKGEPSKRPLPKQLEPLSKASRKVVGALPTADAPSAAAALPLGSSASPKAGGDMSHLDPWCVAHKTALPGLGGPRSGASAPGSPTLSQGVSPKGGGAAPGVVAEQIVPRSETTIRCLSVSGGIVPMRRWGHGTCVIGSTLYIFGGMRSEPGGDPEACSDMHEFNCESQVWEPSFAAKGEAPQPRHSAAVCAHNDSVYVFGGVSRSGGLHSDTHEYNVETQEWTSLSPPSGGERGGGGCASDEGSSSPLPAAKRAPERAETPACFYGRRLVIFGGRTYKEKDPYSESASDRRKLAYCNDVWTFDVKQKKWRHFKAPKGGGPRKRSSHAACVARDSLVIHGGGDTSDVFNDTWMFDFESHVWREVRVDGPSRSGHSMHFLGECLYVFGGLQDNTASSASNKPNNTVLQWAHLPQQQALEHAEGGAQQGGAVGPYLVWRNVVTSSTAHFLPNASVSAFGGAGVRNGVLTLFGGRLGTTMSKAPSNHVFTLLLTNDILVEKRSLQQAMSKLLRRAQTRPRDWCADLALSVNGRVRYCHSAILAARCPEFFAKLLHDTGSEDAFARWRADPSRFLVATKPLEIILDTNKRRAGLPAVATSDLLMNILHYYYTGKLLDYDELESLAEVSNSLKLAGLADFLALINPPQGGRRKDKVLSAPLSERIARAEQVGDQQFVATMSSFLAHPDSADMILCSDAANASCIPCLSTVVAASSPFIRKALHHVHPGRSYAEKHYRVETTEDHKTRLVLLDLPSSAIEAAVKFMCTGSCEVDLVTAAGVMATANVLRLPILRTLCEKQVWQLMVDQDLEAKCSLLGLADRYHAEQLREKIIGDIAPSDSSAVSKLDAFATLAEPLQKELLQACDECSVRVRLPGGPTQRPPAAYQGRIDALNGAAHTLGR